MDRALTLALLLYAAFAALTVLIMVVIPLILAPWKSSKSKRVSFECGQKPLRWERTAFPVEYFPYLIIYVTYAVVGIVAFLSAMALSSIPEIADRVLILFAALTVGAVYASVHLRRLSQRLVGERVGE